MFLKIFLKDTLKFKQLLIVNGYTERSFSKKISKSTSYINQVINKKRNPKANTVQEICNILQIQFDDFFYTENACKSERNKKD